MAGIDLNNIKEQTQTLFQTANTTGAATTTATTTDLSGNLTTRVQRIVKTNTTRVPVQASLYPYVSVFIEDKTTDIELFAVDPATPLRTGSVNLQVLGAVWNSMVVDIDEDAADEDCENLMMNIEAILATDYNLNGAVNWQQPVSVKYHNVALDEGVSLRVGVMEVECMVFY